MFGTASPLCESCQLLTLHGVGVEETTVSERKELEQIVNGLGVENCGGWDGVSGKSVGDGVAEVHRHRSHVVGMNEAVIFESEIVVDVGAVEPVAQGASVNEL